METRGQQTGRDPIQPSPSEWREVAGLWGWSQRESETARLLATGVSRKEAAEALNIGASTVQTHFRRALRKAGAKDVIALIWKIVSVRDRLRTQ